MIIDENTKVLVQGITGKEGSRATKAMLGAGMKITAGVTPGKKGQEVEGVPVFDSVKEAKEFDASINTSVLYVPPLFLFGAAKEALENGIKLLVIITENVPVKDSMKLYSIAKEKGARIIGPSSVGVLTPGKGRLGSIGGMEESDMFSKGNVGILSKSGGMCAETALILTQAGIGQSTVIGIGGDVIIGSNFVDLLELFEKDDDTKVMVLYGEIGGNYEEQVADMVLEKKFTKPIVAFISGQFAESISRSLAFGHAGAIIQEGKGKAEDKKQRLKNAGVLIADYHDDIPSLVKKALENGI